MNPQVARRWRVAVDLRLRRLQPATVVMQPSLKDRFRGLAYLDLIHCEIGQPIRQNAAAISSSLPGLQGLALWAGDVDPTHQVLAAAHSYQRSPPAL